MSTMDSLVSYSDLFAFAGLVVSVINLTVNIVFQVIEYKQSKHRKRKKRK